MPKAANELFNDPFNDGSLTGSLASDNMWIKGAIFISLTLFAVLIVSALINWLIKNLDLKSPKTSVRDFHKASKIDLFLFDDEKVTLQNGTEEFEKFISFFSDDAQDNHENIHFVKAHVFIDMRKYVLNFSNEGWNFSGETRNCRCLDNPLGLILFLEKLEEEHYGRSEN